MNYFSLLAFALIYAAATLIWHVPYAIAGVYAGASVTCFIAYALDKAAAKAGRWRTEEATLLMLGLLCGWPGAVLAQAWLRHKSQKASFRGQFWGTVLVNIGAFVYLVSPISILRHYL
jgi:uncharacterized membrane protein YsdA (DUF1294 family)